MLDRPANLAALTLFLWTGLAHGALDHGEREGELLLGNEQVDS